MKRRMGADKHGKELIALSVPEDNDGDDRPTLTSPDEAGIASFKQKHHKENRWVPRLQKALPMRTLALPLVVDTRHH